MSGSDSTGGRRSWPAIAWTALLLVAMVIPGAYVPGSMWSLDKLAHFVLFAGFAWLWLRAAPGAWLPVGIVGLLYGVLTEVGQSVLPGERTGDPMDVFANVLGLAAGILLPLAVARRKRRRRAGSRPHTEGSNRGAG
jgi:VanZ family protein